MTIHIDNLALFILACILAVVVLTMAANFAVMGAFADGFARFACFLLAVGTAAGAVLIVMAGGGWL